MKVDLVRQVGLKLQHIAIEFFVKETRLTETILIGTKGQVKVLRVSRIRRKIREVTVRIRTATVNTEVFL